jgi:transcriptional regulator with XRE-family HTH domain
MALRLLFNNSFRGLGKQMNKTLATDFAEYTGLTMHESNEFSGFSGPHPIDRHVGLRIRMRRKELGITQEKLAQALGLTFQQVQKYERGANRVSASKLWEVARALQAPVGYFYDGLAEGSESSTSSTSLTDAQEFLLSAEGIELATTFPRVARPRLRRKILELVRTMAEAEEAADLSSIEH